MAIRLGLGVSAENMEYRNVVALSQEAEALGYDYVWIAFDRFARDMYVTATAVATHTDRIKVGTWVADPYTHHPALTAMAVATLGEASGGRAMLGLGAGVTGFAAMGIERVRPARAIREAVHVIRALWRGETVDYEGEIIRLHNARLEFDVRPGIPIVVATRGDLVLRTAGEVADGVMIGSYAEPEGLGHALSMIERGVDRAGRELDELAVHTRVDACISGDRRVAMDAVREYLGFILWNSYPDRSFVRRFGLEVPARLEEVIARRDYGLMSSAFNLVPDGFVDRFCWAGTAEDVAAKVIDVVNLGIEDITFLPHAPAGGDILETVREFAGAVRQIVDGAASP